MGTHVAKPLRHRALAEALERVLAAAEQHEAPTPGAHALRP